MIWFILSIIFSALLSGMGIGGGTLFILIATNFLNMEQKTAQIINLIMFISTGFLASLNNIKSKRIDKNIVKKILPLMLVGSAIGYIIFSKMNTQKLRLYFTIFTAIIGCYEIISSLINIKKANNKK